MCHNFYRNSVETISVCQVILANVYWLMPEPGCWYSYSSCCPAEGCIPVPNCIVCLAIVLTIVILTVCFWKFLDSCIATTEIPGIKSIRVGIWHLSEASGDPRVLQPPESEATTPSWRDFSIRAKACGGRGSATDQTQLGNLFRQPWIWIQLLYHQES